MARIHLLASVPLGLGAFAGQEKIFPEGRSNGDMVLLASLFSRLCPNLLSLLPALVLLLALVLQ